MYALAIRAGTVITEAVAKNPALLTRLTSKLSLVGKRATLTGVIDAVSKSKSLAAIALWEVGGDALNLLKEWMGGDAEMKEIGSIFGPQETAMSDTKSAGDVVEYFDEVADIHAAVTRFGGLTQFLQVRRALTLGSDSVAMYLKAVALARLVS